MATALGRAIRPCAVLPAKELPMPELSSVFTELRKVMAPYAAKLAPTRDDDQELYIDTRHIQKNKKRKLPRQADNSKLELLVCC